jgi:hypothetical protein
MSDFLSVVADILIIIAAGKFIWKHIPSSDDLYSIRKSFIDFRDEAKQLKEEVVNLRRVELTNIAENLKTRDATAKKTVPVEDIDKKLGSFQQSVTRMDRYMTTTLATHVAVIKSIDSIEGRYAQMEERFGQTETTLRNVARRLHMR